MPVAGLIARQLFKMLVKNWDRLLWLKNRAAFQAVALQRYQKSPKPKLVHKQRRGVVSQATSTHNYAFRSRKQVSPNAQPISKGIYYSQPRAFLTICIFVCKRSCHMYYMQTSEATTSSSKRALHNTTLPDSSRHSWSYCLSLLHMGFFWHKDFSLCTRLVFN